FSSKCSPARRATCRPRQLPAMLFHSLPAGPRGLALARRAFLQLVPLCGPRTAIAWHGIRMHIRSAIHPSAVPARIVDEHAVLIPAEPVHAPSPGPERRANGDAKTKADRAAHKETGPWRSEYDQWIIVRHDHECGVRRQNLDVGAAIDDNLRVGSQI